MAINIKLDLIRKSYIREIIGGVEIGRGFIATGIPIVAGGANDPSVLINVLTAAGLPTLRSLHPSPWALGAKLEARQVDPVSPIVKDTAEGVLIYRRNQNASGGTPTWSITDADQLAQVETYATADGSDNLTVWYLAKQAAVFGPPPVGAGQRTPHARKFVVSRVVKATTAMLGDDWNSYKASVRGLAGKINSSTWAGKPRGYWLYAGATMRTTDYGISYTVELTFLGKDELFFQLLAYFDAHGGHNPDCVTEAALRAQGVPAVGQKIRGNGLALASTQLEGDYNGVFDFGGYL